jgi:hypothetical protein
MTNFNVFIPWCHYHVMSLFQSSNSLFYSSRPCFSFCWSTLLKQTNIPISPSAQNLCNNFMNNILSVPIFCRSSPELIHHSSVIIVFYNFKLACSLLEETLIHSDRVWIAMELLGLEHVSMRLNTFKTHLPSSYTSTTKEKNAVLWWRTWYFQHSEAATFEDILKVWLTSYNEPD